MGIFKDRYLIEGNLENTEKHRDEKQIVHQFHLEMNMHFIQRYKKNEVKESRREYFIGESC